MKKFIVPILLLFCYQVSAQNVADTIMASFVNDHFNKITCNKTYILNEPLLEKEFVMSQVDCVRRGVIVNGITCDVSDSTIEHNFDKTNVITDDKYKKLFEINAKVIKRKSKRRLERKNSKLANRFIDKGCVTKNKRLCLNLVVELSEPIKIDNGHWLIYYKRGFYRSNYDYDFLIGTKNKKGEWNFTVLPCGGGQ